MDSEIVGEDFLDFKCPYCGALNSFEVSAAKLVRECVNCLDLFIVPARDGEAARNLSATVEGPRILLRALQAPDWKDLLEFQFADEDEATGWIPRSGTLRTSEARQPFYLAVEVREYFIPDFTHWKNHDAFELAFARLLKDLRQSTQPVPRS